MKVNENGYTLLEILLVLLVLFTISSTLPLLFTLLQKWTYQAEGLHPFEWEIATAQIGMDVKEGDEIIIDQGKLLVKQSANVVTYELYRNILRRQVNGTGHEVILQNLDSVKFRYMKGVLSIIVMDVDGKEYKSTLYRWLDVINDE